MFDISAGVSFQIVFLFLFMVSSLEIDVAFIFAFFIRYIFLPTCSDIAVKLPHRGDGVVALDESLECALSNRTSLAQNVPSISSLQCWNFLNLTMAPEYEGSTFTAFSDTQYEKDWKRPYGADCFLCISCLHLAADQLRMLLRQAQVQTQKTLARVSASWRTEIAWRWLGLNETPLQTKMLSVLGLKTSFGRWQRASWLMYSPAWLKQDVFGLTNGSARSFQFGGSVCRSCIALFSNSFSVPLTRDKNRWKLLKFVANATINHHFTGSPKAWQFDMISHPPICNMAPSASSAKNASKVMPFLWTLQAAVQEKMWILHLPIWNLHLPRSLPGTPVIYTRLAPKSCCCLGSTCIRQAFAGRFDSLDSLNVSTDKRAIEMDESRLISLKFLFFCDCLYCFGQR